MHSARKRCQSTFRCRAVCLLHFFHVLPLTYTVALSFNQYVNPIALAVRLPAPYHLYPKLTLRPSPGNTTLSSPASKSSSSSLRGSSSSRLGAAPSRRRRYCMMDPRRLRGRRRRRRRTRTTCLPRRRMPSRSLWRAEMSGGLLSGSIVCKGPDVMYSTDCIESCFGRGDKSDR